MSVSKLKSDTPNTNLLACAYFNYKRRFQISKPEEAYFQFEHAEFSLESKETVIKEVCLCGTSSKNGYNFANSAFGSEENAKSLYEGKPVFFDHKPYDNGVKELAGVVTNVRLKNNKPYGDIETADVPLGDQLRSIVGSETIKKTKLKLGMSHVARYRFNEDRSVVEEVVEVQSVDVVINPATTQNFKENTNLSNEENLVEKQAIELIKTQLEAAQADVDKYKTKADSLESELNTAKAELEVAKTDLASAVQKVEAFELKEQKAALEAQIAAELDTCVSEGHLKAEHITENFKALYTSIESEESRKSLLQDRIDIFKNVGAVSTARETKNTNEPQSAEAWAEQYEKGAK